MAVLTNLGVPSNSGAQPTLMPKLSYRFRVTFNGIAGKSAEVVTNNVNSVTRPELSHEEVVIDTYNSKIYMAGKHSWNQITVEMRDDVDSETSFILDQQVARQIDMAEQSAPRAASSYKFSMKIENLDGGRADTDVLDTWNLAGCYIAQLNYGESNYSNGSALQTITMQIRYDNASHTVGGTDSFTDNSPADDSSIAT